MKHKVSELQGALLDAAVAMAEGLPVHPGRDNFIVADSIDTVYADERHYSRLWEHGGPIIERERILTGAYMGQWIAMHGAQIVDSGSDTLAMGGAHGVGPTPLIAAMRAYVASRFGQEVEIP